MKNIIYTILAIATCLAAGKLLYNTVGGLPASLYGMIIYCLLLQLGWLTPNKIHLANQWAIKHMGVCFIPAAVGIINHFELIKNHGFAIISVIFVTTFLLLTFVGLLAEKYLTTKPLPASSTSND
jgi:holin-like protein